MVASVSEPGRRTERRCSKGSKLGHFAWFCKSKRKIKEVTEEPAENNEVANFFGITTVVLSPLEAMVESVILQIGKTKTFPTLFHAQHKSICG